MENTTLRIEYKKFNTFLFDYLKTISQGWLFMKMKHKYPVGTVLNLHLTVANIEKSIGIKCTVIFQGDNEEGKEGIGLKVFIEKHTADYLYKAIKKVCMEKYGEHWGSMIMNIMDRKETTPNA